MINKRLIELANRLKNDEVPRERAVEEKRARPALFGGVDYTFLTGDDGREILDEYTARVQSDYGNAKALQVLKYNEEEGLVTGSNSFSSVLIDQILRDNNTGYRLTRPVDQEMIIQLGEPELKGTYSYTGLVLRSTKNPNSYLAQDMESQLQARSGSDGLVKPLLISLSGLELRTDTNSPHGLAFNLTDESDLFHATELEESNHFSKFDETDSRGMPIFDEKGKRTLFTASEGLRALFRDWNLGLFARSYDLAYSNGGGRVVVSAEGTREKSSGGIK
jgi:hypothetical protein